MKKNILYIFILAIFVYSCSLNYNTARDIKERYSREYNGIDTLLKIDGYYYESSEESFSPFVLTSYGGFYKYFVKFDSHADIHGFINDVYPPPFRGNYKISNDIIKAKWVSKYDLGKYDIFEEHFIILNDSTLARYYRSYGRGERIEKIMDITDSVNIFKFYPFELPNKIYQ